MKYAVAMLAIFAFAVPAASQPSVPQTPEEGSSAPPEQVPDPQAAAPEPVTEPEPFFDVLNNSRLTGDWWGGRTWLEDHGIEFGLYMTNVYQHNVHGGLQTHRGHRLTGSVDYELAFDLGVMGLLEGGVIFVAGESSWNDGIGEDRVGSLFGVNDDAGGDEETIVADLWFEQTFWDSRARFRIGRIGFTTDLEANAYANDETSQFLNSALVNATNFQTPDDGLGAQLVVQPWDWFYVAVTAADAQANGHRNGFRTTFHDEDYFFAAGEFGFLPIWDTSWGKLPGGYRFGLWYDPQPKEVFFDDLGGRRRTIPLKRDDLGFYFNMDQMVWKENPDDDADSQGVGMFVRYSFAHEDANAIEHFWSIGAQYQGLIPTRDDDVLGFGFAQGIISDQLAELDGGDRESVYELYYNAALLPWLSISPDFQYIVNPGANGGRDAFVAGLRLQMSF